MATREYYNKKKAVGDIGEDKFEKALNLQNCKALYRAPNNVSDKKQDFIYINSKGVEVRAEIKTNDKATENLFVQVARNGHPSGPFCTEADFYVFYDSATKLFYGAKSVDLRNFIKLNNFIKVRNMQNINEETYGILINKEVFKNLEFSKMYYEDGSKYP